VNAPDGVVLELRRHPVKSVEGELLDECLVDRRGLVGDRLWAVCDPDGKLGSGKSSRRFRRMDGLRELVAAYQGDVPVVTFPDGSTVRGDGREIHERLSVTSAGRSGLSGKGPCRTSTTAPSTS
jgi:uncharacterized protein YcbX